MVLDKSIETLEDLVRFLNRKQSFYFKLYDRYLEGDHNRLDDSRKHEVDCDAVCDDIVECIKAISDEAQIRGVAKKPKVLCTLDGQDEEKYILDEWLLKVVRLLDDKVNWNRMLAPVEGKDMNNAFDAILFRLTYVVNSLKELSNKTESMRESSLKEAEITKYMACCYDPEDYFEETNYIDEDGELRCNSSDAKLFNTEDEAIEYADEIKPIGWMSFAMPFNTTLNESDKTYKAKAGKKWLKGDKLVKSKAAADSFESKTEPTQRLNQMKKDGKLDKDVNIDVVEGDTVSIDDVIEEQKPKRSRKRKNIESIEE